MKLDQDEGPRPELEPVDFELCHEVLRLLRKIEGIKNGKVARLEVRNGVPRRATFEAALTGGLLSYLQLPVSRI